MLCYGLMAAPYQKKHHTVVTWVRHHYAWFVFGALVTIGMYLRFWNFEFAFEYGWDQARDAWKIRDILGGTLVLDGPRTGVGSFFLGPLWFYYLAPFYHLTKLDPIGAMWGNIVVNIGNFFIFFLVSKRIWGEKFALLATYILTVNGYLIDITKTPWNVSPVFGVSALIFYCIHEIVIREKYKLVFPLAFLTGLFTQLHFAVVFLPPIILLSFIFVKRKWHLITMSVASLPLFLMWFVPLIFLDMQWKGDNTSWFQRFLSEYIIDGFYVRFFLFRIHDAFVQFERVLAIPHTIAWGKFIVPAIFAIVTLKVSRTEKIRNILMGLWFLVPACVYTLYSGTTSEYYVLLNAPIAIYITIYLAQKLWRSSLKLRPVFILIGIVVIAFYTHRTSANHWIKSTEGGLARKKSETRKCIEGGCVKEYNVGFIDSYLYSTWTDPKYKNYPKQ